MKLLRIVGSRRDGRASAARVRPLDDRQDRVAIAYMKTVTQTVLELAARANGPASGGTRRDEYVLQQKAARSKSSAETHAA